MRCWQAMNKERQRRVVAALLERHGTTYAEEIGIRLKNTPSPLFQLLVASILFSARIGAPQAVQAARALNDRGLTTPGKMAAAGWEKRVRILNENGYARYDESTSRMLGDTCEIIQEKYDGDLRRLREEAARDSSREHEGLTVFKGIGDAGARIFLREVQAIWEEVHPFIDPLARQGADALGLPKSAKTLAGLVDGPAETARLAAALVRVKLADGADAVLEAA